MTMIPHIIHQTGPADKTYWHPVWFEGQKAWSELYPTFYRMTWDDSDIDALIEHKYPYHWKRYINMHLHALRIDVSRLFILHQYGGIYADLDYIPLRHFYSELNGDFCAVGAYTDDEVVQNSLMASVQLNNDVLTVIDRIFDEYDRVGKDIDMTYDDYVRTISGPIAISRNLGLFNNLQILDNKLFNPDHTAQHGPEIRGKHMLTGIWGQDIIGLYDTKEEYFEKQMEWYKKARTHDYTHYRPLDAA